VEIGNRSWLAGEECRPRRGWRAAHQGQECAHKPSFVGLPMGPRATAALRKAPSRNMKALSAMRAAPGRGSGLAKTHGMQTGHGVDPQA